MTCYTDSEVPIKDEGDEEPSEMSNTSSITDDGNGHLEKGSSVDEINDTMASSSTMEASTSSNELKLRHISSKTSCGQGSPSDI